MKKNNIIIIGIVVVVVVAGGAFALFHKSSTPAYTASSGSTTSSPTNAPAVNNAVIITKKDATVGQYLADPSGKALYTYGGDSSGVSTCTGTCLTNWPAYQATGSTSNLPAGIATIKRTDNGEVQFTYMGMPLYYFASDSAGQVTGNGVNNFSVAKPSASTSSSSSSAAPAPTSTPSQPSSSSSSSSGYPY